MASRVNANVVATIGFVVLKALLRSEYRCKALTAASERAVGMVVVEMVRPRGTLTFGLPTPMPRY